MISDVNSWGGVITGVVCKNQYFNQDTSKLTPTVGVGFFLRRVKNVTDLKFSAECLATGRDIFLFCCYTGLAYADVQKLRSVDIVIGHDGEK